MDIKPGEFKYLPNGNKWTCGQPAIVVGCEGGYLIACQSGDPGIYDEISVDFVSDDGFLQLATVGRTEDEDEAHWVNDEGYQPMHVFAYDGVDEDVAHIQYVTINEK